MNSQITKSEVGVISTSLIVYFTSCGALWHLGYWSTFGINILQYLSATEIIKSFVFPFLSSAFVILLSYIVANYVTIADNLGKPDQF